MEQCQNLVKEIFGDILDTASVGSLTPVIQHGNTTRVCMLCVINRQNASEFAKKDIKINFDLKKVKKDLLQLIVGFPEIKDTPEFKTGVIMDKHLRKVFEQMEEGYIWITDENHRLISVYKIEWNKEKILKKL